MSGVRGPKRRAGKPRARRKRLRPDSRKLRWGIALVTVAVLLIGARGALAIWASRPGSGSGQRLVIDWPAGLDATQSADRLAELGLVKSPWLLGWYLRLQARTLEPGQHVLNDRLSPGELVQRLARTRWRSSVNLVVPEGFNHLQIAARLEEQEICPAAAFRRAVEDPRALAELGLSGESAEGFLFPATYELRVDSEPAEILKTLLSTFESRFASVAKRHPEAIATLARERGFGQREIVTLASIVEKETARADEKPLVASVYLNRLSDESFQPARMLQADPTAAYGCALAPTSAPSCAGYEGRVTPAMLRDPANRYNTYKHPGLPPGPIANPGTAALEAVLAPAKTDYLFFVAGADGRHKFSRTLEDHNRAINER